MSIEHMYDATAVTYRMSPVDDSDIKESLATYLPSFPCMVQPLEPVIGETIPGGFGKSWVMFCPIKDFKEGDKVVVNSTDEYKIIGVETFNFGNNPHCEVMIRDFKE